MSDRARTITESTLIPLSFMVAIMSAVWALADWRHDSDENARRIGQLERRVDGLSSMRDDLASIKFKVDLIRVEVRKPR